MDWAMTPIADSSGSNGSPQPGPSHSPNAKAMQADAASMTRRVSFLTALRAEETTSKPHERSRQSGAIKDQANSFGAIDLSCSELANGPLVRCDHMNTPTTESGMTMIIGAIHVAISIRANEVAGSVLFK